MPLGFWQPQANYQTYQIEFPSILLPPSISSGSIVDITVARNIDSENTALIAFQGLQSSILATYGQRSPSPPVIRCRNATQTSIVLEWDPIDLATADIRSLSLYRNGNKAGGIPRPLETTATKISGLAVDTEYMFYLVLRTSAGQYTSEKLVVRTHKMTDLSGITVTPGVLPAPLRESLTGAVERIGGRIADTVRIDTTHFVCTEGRGREWERAVETNIPIVRPEWVEGCEREGRIVGVRGYYLNADPRLRKVGQSVIQQQQQQQQQQSPVLQQQQQPQQQQQQQQKNRLSQQKTHDESSPQRAPPPQELQPQQLSQYQPSDLPTTSTPQTPSFSRPQPSPNHPPQASEDNGPPPPEKDTPQPTSNSHPAPAIDGADSDQDSSDSAQTSIQQSQQRSDLGIIQTKEVREWNGSPGVQEDEASFSEVRLWYLIYLLSFSFSTFKGGEEGEKTKGKQIF